MRNCLRAIGIYWPVVVDNKPESKIYQRNVECIWSIVNVHAISVGENYIIWIWLLLTDSLCNGFRLSVITCSVLSLLVALVTLYAQSTVVKFMKIELHIIGDVVMIIYILQWCVIIPWLNNSSLSVIIDYTQAQCSSECLIYKNVSFLTIIYRDSDFFSSCNSILCNSSNERNPIIVSLLFCFF